GKFLAYPDERQAKLYGTDAQGKRTEEFLDVVQYAVKRSSFANYADAIQQLNERRLQAVAQAPGFDTDLGPRIDSDSYQIDAPEAKLIAAVLTALPQPGGTQEPIYKKLYVAHDDILGQPAFAAVFEMPHTFWKIVTVMPYSTAVAASREIYLNLITAIAFVMALSLLVMLLVTRRILVRPLTAMTRQVQQLTEADSDDRRMLELPGRGELGWLAYWFNRRTEKLLETQRELRDVQEKLEQRVEERTEALREEMTQRQGVQQTREQQMWRMERQHSAIVQLSLHEQLRRGDIVAAAKSINEAVAEVAAVDRASVWVTDSQHQGLELVDLFDRDSGTHRSGMWLELEKYPSYFAALAQDRSIAVPDIYTDRRTVELVEYARANGIGALLDSPIRVGGELRGVVCFEHLGGSRDWQEDEIRFAGEIADQMLHTLSNAERLESERQIRQLAFYDPLTELANRRLLQETAQHEIDVAQRHEVFGSLLYLDLDNFKTLNDSLGHHVGDELLVQVARRIRAALRKEDTAARLGGDEFVVLISAECPTRALALEQAMVVARKIQDALMAPYRLHGHEYVITSSMGITLYPEAEGNATDALKQADTAMYRAKDEGKNRIRFYSPEMQAAADRRRQVEQELRTAITAGEFVLHYQPQIDASGSMVAAEALVRWRHWSRGEVGPAEFIPVAEETGLILELGAWILREACRFSLRSTLGRVAINISAIQFQQADFVETVKHVLRDTGARPEAIMLELTEGILIADIDDTIVKMHALKALGIGMSIDDFGTGYSSLAYLKQLPLDQLKINDKFVRDVTVNSNDAIIAETIISMARHLGLQVVAEGVEELEQLQFLADKGCDLFQGYHISRPLPEADFEVFLRSRAWLPN
ncbi:MAG: EAL domain-containing protein, partial [Gammaproteobacteria bacterium]|nr:EAL domain-containing protein [Gammaproteobacteria bacterium]